MTVKEKNDMATKWRFEVDPVYGVRAVGERWDETRGWVVRRMTAASVAALLTRLDRAGELGKK